MRSVFFKPLRAMRLASPMLKGKRRRGLDDKRTAARHLKKATLNRYFDRSQRVLIKKAAGA
jgi:inhibitor of KinA sporulation pathway (predicted exonuclease)